MTVEIICVGTEILMGNIVNTNAAFMAERCAALGLTCYYQSVVGDNAKRLTEIVRTAMGRSDIILLSGGLGPTEDDLTKESVAKVCGLELVEDAEARANIERLFSQWGRTPTENNWKQAMVPKGCIVLQNPNGTAPGMIIETPKNKIALLPGPPDELLPMFRDQVEPYLADISNESFYTKTVKIWGVGESSVETQILDLIDGQSNPTLATYAKLGEVHVRVTGSAETYKDAKRLVKPVVTELKDRFGSVVFASDDEVTLEQAVVDLLIANGLTIACAESCTGGLLSGRIINVPGVSACYKCGMVTYSNKSKRKLLGVKKGTLHRFGAVSEQTAEEMARGLANLTKADVTISITGIAGPEGGTEEKPVGLVYIGCCVRGRTKVLECRFHGTRAKVRELSVTKALGFARQCILEYTSEQMQG